MFDGGHLKRIGVRSGYRKQEVGSALLKEVIRECRLHREKRLCLAVQADNAGAVAFYEKTGFHATGKAYQFRATFGDTDSERIRAVEACGLDPALRRICGEAWAWLLRKHEPPHTVVLVFTDDNHEFRGICRLAPDFPGCKPFHVEHPERDVRAAVASLRGFVPRSHEHVLFTFSSEQLARACVDAGFSLNYELVNMALRLEGMV